MTHSLKEVKALSEAYANLTNNLGLTLDDYEPIEVYGGDYQYATITIKVKLDDTKGIPPEILRFFKAEDHDMERLSRKGNIEKRTRAGMIYELSLREYLTAELKKHSEYPGDYVSQSKATTYLKIYQATRERLWDEVCATNKFYLDDLEENFA